MSNPGEQPSPQGPDFQPNPGTTPSPEEPLAGQPQPGDPYASQQPGDPYAGQQPPSGPPSDQYPQGEPSGQYPQGEPPAGPPQQPYGQQGAPHPQEDPYAAAHAQGFDQAQEAPKPNNGLNLKVMIPIVLAIAVGGWFLWNNFGNNVPTANAGDCLVLSGTTENVDHEVVDCDDTSIFSYVVGSVHDGEVACEFDAVPYMVGTERRGDFSVEQTMCLVEVFHVDECYEFTTDIPGFIRTDCGEVGEGFRLTESIDETEGTCTVGEYMWTYAEPPLTYCGEYLG